jgi:KipI family sensor histidine kinase inhibitor
MIRFEYASDQSLMVYLGDTIDLETHHRVLKLLRMLEIAPIPGIRNLHPAYNSLLIVFDPVELEHAYVQHTVSMCVEEIDSIVLPPPRVVEIPVYYDGPDLEELAALRRMSPQRVIELHSSADYIVYFVGFVPGFAYLGGLPEELATPRLETPRKRVPKGSVAIGGSHTGVYPFETPGGWRLIGRTLLEIFDPESAELSRIRIGDRVRFVPVRQLVLPAVSAHP